MNRRQFISAGSSLFAIGALGLGAGFVPDTAHAAKLSRKCLHARSEFHHASHTIASLKRRIGRHKAALSYDKLKYQEAIEQLRRLRPKLRRAKSNEKQWNKLLRATSIHDHAAYRRVGHEVIRARVIRKKLEKAVRKFELQKLDRRGRISRENKTIAKLKRELLAQQARLRKAERDIRRYCDYGTTNPLRGKKKVPFKPTVGERD